MRQPITLLLRMYIGELLCDFQLCIAASNDDMSCVMCTVPNNAVSV